VTWDICPAATRVTQAFGCTDFAGEWWAPWCPGGHFHAGVDLAADGIGGQPVFATRAGLVVANQDPAHTITLCPEIGGGTVTEPYLGPFAVILQVVEADGTVVWIEHGHLRGANVSPGQLVAPGDLLGWVGTRGASCGDHLHVEVRADGPRQGVDNQAAAVRDPTPYLEAEMNEQQMRAFLDGLAREVQGQSTFSGWMQSVLGTEQADFNALGAVKTELDTMKAEIEAGGSVDAAAAIARIEAALQKA
jgi:murein DD-endopeptidase MepM/ murein hydrolase activator NlpD